MIKVTLVLIFSNNGFETISFVDLPLLFDEKEYSASSAMT